MNSIRRTVSRRNRRLAQSIFVILLIISAVALAIAIFFPTFEYIKYYRKDPSYYKFDPAARAPAAPVVPASPVAPEPAPAAAPEAAPEAAPAPEAGPTPPPAETDATAAPQPVEGAAAPGSRPYSYVGLPAERRVPNQDSWRVPERAQ